MNADGKVFQIELKKKQKKTTNNEEQLDENDREISLVGGKGPPRFEGRPDLHIRCEDPSGNLHIGSDDRRLICIRWNQDAKRKRLKKKGLVGH